MKIKLLSALSAALALTATAVGAQEEMEKCSVVKDGKGQIKATKGDCKTMAHSCAGQNTKGEIDAFILVPAGECLKINKGDFSGVKENVKEKIEFKS